MKESTLQTSIGALESTSLTSTSSLLPALSFPNQLTQAATAANLQLYKQQQGRGTFSFPSGRLSHPVAMAMFQQAAASSAMKPRNALSFGKPPGPPLLSSGSVRSSLYYSTPPPLSTNLESLHESLRKQKDNGMPALTAGKSHPQSSLPVSAPASLFNSSEIGIRLHTETPNLIGRPSLPRPNSAGGIFHRNRSSSFGIY